MKGMGLDKEALRALIVLGFLRHGQEGLNNSSGREQVGGGRQR